MNVSTAVAVTARREIAKLARDGHTIVDSICERMNVTALDENDAQHLLGCLRALADDIDDDLRHGDIDEAWRVLTGRAWAATEAEVNE